MAYGNGSLDQNTTNFFLTAALSLFFPFLALSYMINKGTKPQELISALGLGRDKFSMGLVNLGIIIFFALFTLDLLVNVLGIVINTPINTNVGVLLGSAPLWFYVFTAIIAPINEEIFFRAFLVPRLGILLSAVVFGILHASYDSTFGVEIIAAILFGLIAGYVFKKTKSLYPSMIAHILINSLAIIALGVI